MNKEPKKKNINEAVKELKGELKITDVDLALEESKKPVQRLGQGIHNDIFYYGTTLTWNKKPVSAIVTSERKVYLGLNYVTWKCDKCGFLEVRKSPAYEDINKNKPKKCDCERASSNDLKIARIWNPIRDEFGLMYRTEFNDDALDHVWQTESIRRYLENKYKKESLLDIFARIRHLNEKYIDHYEMGSHIFVTCWIIASFCNALFEHFGRLYFRGHRGSGKTKECRVIRFLSFNPMWVTKGTLSSIFRDAEATCGTFIVDNMDKLNDEAKLSMEHHIETGWMHDATYRLTDKETMRTQKLLSYGAMALNNIFGLDENTIDKTFEIPMLKSVNTEIKRLKPRVKSEDWESVRDSTRIWMLDNWQKVNESYNKIVSDFSGREFDVVEAVLTIGRMLDKETYQDLESYIKKRIEEEMLSLENNPAYMVFSRIWKQFREGDIKQNVFLAPLSNEIFPLMYGDIEEGSKEYRDRKRTFSRYVGKTIRAVPMFRKGGLSNGRTYIEIKKSELEKYMKLQKFIDDNGRLAEDRDDSSDDVSLHTSTNSINSTTSTNSTSNPKKPIKANSKVEQVEVVEQVEIESTSRDNLKNEFKSKEEKEKAIQSLITKPLSQKEK